MARVFRIDGTTSTRRLGSTRAGPQHVLVHDPPERGQVSEEVSVRGRLRPAVRGDHRVVLVHLLAGAAEQAQAGGTQQTIRPNCQRERRGLPADDADADHLPVLPGVLPAADDHERGGRRHHVPLAAHHRLHPRLGVQRHQPTHLRSHQPPVPRSLRQFTKILQKQHRQEAHDVGQPDHGQLLQLTALRRQTKPHEG